MNNMRLSVETVLILFLLRISNASGEMLEDITLMSPKAMAMANAVTADPPLIDAIHFNPAGLIRIKNSATELKVATVYPISHLRTGSQAVDPQVVDLYESATGTSYPTDPLANKSSETSDTVAVLPGKRIEELSFPLLLLGGIAIRDESRPMVFGSAVYTPMITGYRRSNEDLGRYDARESATTRITYFSPTIAFPVINDFSIGLGINFSYQGFDLSSDLRAPQASIAILGGYTNAIPNIPKLPAPYEDQADFSVIMESFSSVGFNAGLLWSPNQWFNFGLSYRSPTRSRLKGEYTFNYLPVMTNLFQSLGPILGLKGESVQSGKADMEFVTPQHLAIGTSIKVTPSFKLNCDVKRSFYSDWDKFVINFDQSIDYLVFASFLDEDASSHSLTLERNYQDATSYSIAFEYQWNNNLDLRAGYQMRNSSIPNESLSLSVPISDANYYGLGFEYRFSKDSKVQMGLSYMTSKYTIGYNQSNNANSGDPLNIIYNPYTYLPLEVKTTVTSLSISYYRSI